MRKEIEVRAATTQQRVLDGKCDLVQSFDRISDAKERAKYYLTDEYQRVTEAPEPLVYAQVIVGDECVADYFRKE